MILERSCFLLRLLRDNPLFANDLFTPIRRDVRHKGVRAYDEVPFRVRLSVSDNRFSVLFMSNLPNRVSGLVRSFARIIRFVNDPRVVLRVSTSGSVDSRDANCINQRVVFRTAIRGGLVARTRQDRCTKGDRANTRNNDRRSIVGCGFVSICCVLQSANGQSERFVRISKIIVASYRFQGGVNRVLTFSGASRRVNLRVLLWEGERSMNFQILAFNRNLIFPASAITRRREPVLVVSRTVRLVKDVASKVGPTSSKPRANSSGVVSESAYFFGRFRDTSINRSLNASAARSRDGALALLNVCE